jgi:hypothetical protein
MQGVSLIKAPDVHKPDWLLLCLEWGVIAAVSRSRF